MRAYLFVIPANFLGRSDSIGVLLLGDRGKYLKLLLKGLLVFHGGSSTEIVLLCHRLIGNKDHYMRKYLSGNQHYQEYMQNRHLNSRILTVLRVEIEVLIESVMVHLLVDCLDPLRVKLSVYE